MGIINSKVDLNRLKQYSRYELKIESYYYPNIILNLDNNVIETAPNNKSNIVLYNTTRKYIYFSTLQRYIHLELKYDLSKGRIFFYDINTRRYVYYDIYEINPLPPEYSYI